MNKKGFTLIEVIVSIVLVSVVLVSMMATLLRLRDTYSIIHDNSDVIVYSSSIARVINNDLKKKTRDNKRRNIYWRRKRCRTHKNKDNIKVYKYNSR